MTRDAGEHRIVKRKRSEGWPKYTGHSVCCVTVHKLIPAGRNRQLEIGKVFLVMVNRHTLFRSPRRLLTKDNNEASCECAATGCHVQNERAHSRTRRGVSNLEKLGIGNASLWLHAASHSKTFCQPIPSAC